jgi:SAM-dependent methyltransferase
LLESARARAEAERLPIAYELGDAENLPFADGEFDAVVSTFGVMFASRPEAAAAELARVCRRNGRIALTTWANDGNVYQMFKVMQRYMAAPPNPAPPSPFEWGRSERISELLGESFQLRFEKATSFYREPNGEAWQTFATGYGPTRVLANGPSRIGWRLCAPTSGVSRPLCHRTGICVPREYWLAIGTRV